MQSATVGRLDIDADPHANVRALKNVDGFSAVDLPRINGEFGLESQSVRDPGGDRGGSSPRD